MEFSQLLQQDWIAERSWDREPKGLPCKLSSQEGGTNSCEGIRGKKLPSFPTCSRARVATVVKVAEVTVHVEVVGEVVGVEVAGKAARIKVAREVVGRKAHQERRLTWS